MGLPLYFFGAVAAHELGHAWLAIQQYPHLPKQVEEGLCELIAYLWLGGQNTPEAAFHQRRKRANKDRIYGKGLKRALASLELMAVRQLITYIRVFRRLPV